jgi:phytol kinase
MFFVLTLFLFFLTFILTEFCIKKLGWNGDITRKIAHILASLITFSTPYYLTKGEIVSMGILFSILMIITKSFGLIPSIHTVERKTLGEIYFPIGIALSAFIFLPDHILAFQCGMLVLGISDAMASLVGIPYGKHIYKIFGNKKSLEGSLSFFISTCIILGIFLGRFDGVVVINAGVLTVLEFFLVFGLDNLLLPLVTAYILTMIL